MTRNLAQRKGFHQLGPLTLLEVGYVTERQGALTICAYARSRADAVLLLTMCGLLPQG